MPIRRKRTAAPRHTNLARPAAAPYADVLAGVISLLESARRASARTVNAIMTASYWEIGRRIVEYEQAGRRRAEYGEEILKRLAADLTARFGRGFGWRNLYEMRAFYLAFPNILQTASANSALTSAPSILQTPSAKSSSGAPAIFGRWSGQSPFLGNPTTPLRNSGSSSPLEALKRIGAAFPLSWSHYTRLIRLRSAFAVDFYHAEALRGGWSVRQLDRQVNSQFYERTALSRKKAAMLIKASRSRPEDAVTAEEEVKDPLVLEFLGLRDEYSETDLEEALIRHLESFLLELGGAFAFVGRQRRLRIDHEWFRIDLLFFHRLLRCLVVIDLKTGPMTHADVGQMHLYLNYTKAHWTQPGENPPVGLILCTDRGESLARYALDGLPNKMLVREYLTALPDEEVIAAEIDKTRRALELRHAGLGKRRQPK